MKFDKDTGWFFRAWVYGRIMTYDTLVKARVGAMQYIEDSGMNHNSSVTIFNHENRYKPIGEVCYDGSKRWLYHSMTTHRWYDMRSDGRIKH